MVWSQMKISDLGYSTIDKIWINTCQDKDVDETFKWKFSSKAKLESLSFPRFWIHLKVCKDKGELDWIDRDKSITTHGNMELTCSLDH